MNEFKIWARKWEAKKREKASCSIICGAKAMIQIIRASWHKVMIETPTPHSFLYNPLHFSIHLHISRLKPLQQFQTYSLPNTHLKPLTIKHDCWKGRFGFESKLELPSQPTNPSSYQPHIFFYLFIFSFWTHSS